MKIIPVFILICFAQLSFAQKSFFGVNGGVNLATQQATSPLYAVRGTGGPGQLGTKFYQNTIKPTLGIYYQYGLSSKFALRANAQYMGLGYKNGTNPFNTTNHWTNLDISYLSFLISLKYFVTNHLSLGAGPYLGFTLDGTKILYQDITQFYHKNDFGFAIGAEHDIYKNFALGINYFIGTKNIWLADQGGAYKYYNRALQFTLIYKLKKTS